MNDETGRGADPQGGAPTEEEMHAAFEEQMRRIRVEDVLLQTSATLVNLAAHRLGLTAEPEEEAPERDLEQSKLAIDAVRALVPLCPVEQVEPIRQALSQLQMAYAREAQGGGAPPPQPEDQGQPGAEPPGEARSRIWTPPGT